MLAYVKRRFNYVIFFVHVSFRPNKIGSKNAFLFDVSSPALMTLSGNWGDMVLVRKVQGKLLEVSRMGIVVHGMYRLPDFGFVPRIEHDYTVNMRVAGSMIVPGDVHYQGDPKRQN